MLVRLLRLSAILIILVLAGAYISSMVMPNRYGVLSLVALSFPYAYLLGLIMLFPIYIADKGIGICFFIILSLCTPHMLRYVGFSSDAATEEGDIVIMSFNVMVSSKFTTKEGLRPKEWAEFKQIIEAKPSPDIICFQEINDQAEIGLKNDYPSMNFYRDPKKGALIMTRFPIVDKGVVDKDQRNNGTIWTDLSLNDRLLRIYNVHLQSHRISQASYDNITLAEVSAENFTIGFAEAIRKYRETVPMRARQAEKLKTHANEFSGAIIMSGDFNDSPMSFAYRTLRKGMADAFMKNGKGWGTTWKGRIPLLRIDYILYDDKALINKNYDCISTPLSDHNVIKASFNWY